MTRNIRYSVLCSLCGKHWYCSKVLDTAAQDVEGILSALHSDDLCPFCDQRGPKEVVDINDEKQNSLPFPLLVTRLCKRIKANHIINDQATSFIELPVSENDSVEASVKVFKDSKEYLYYRIRGRAGRLQGLTAMGPVAEVRKIKDNLKDDLYLGIPLQKFSIDQEMDHAVLKLVFKEY
jgi:hypothetical protein